MNGDIFLIILISAMYLTAHLVMFVAYKKAINKTERQGERGWIFVDMLKMKNQLYNLEADGNFQNPL